MYELLKENQCDQVKRLAGKGISRPSFHKHLTEDARKYNAPIHFGRSVERSANEKEVEIVLTQKTRPRQIKDWEITHHDDTT